MRRTSRKSSGSAPFLHWAGALEGFCNVSLLPRGGCYRPHALAEIALVAAPPGHVPGDTAIRADIVAIGPDAAEASCWEHRLYFATQSLMLIELDMIACRALVAGSEPFRALFRQATTARLRRLHGDSSRLGTGERRADWPCDPLLSARPVPPLQ